MSMTALPKSSKHSSKPQKNNSLVRLFWVRQDKRSPMSVQVQMNYKAAHYKC